MLLVAALLFTGSLEAAPRLLVVVVIDQMRADYLDRYAAEYSSGFKILEREGAVFDEAHHKHVPTTTSPGHAALSTGKPPALTGILDNVWWDRTLGREVLSVEDSVYGQGPEKLLTPTLGDALKNQFPTSRILSFSIKDRAAILLGGKKADLVLWASKKAGGFGSSGAYPAPGSWLASFNHGLKSHGKRLKDLDDKELQEFLASPESDKALLALAKKAVKTYRLGRGPSPDILWVSFSALDLIGHAQGPDSQAIHADLLALDKILGRLMRFLAHQVGSKNFDLALSADHGVLPVPEEPAGVAMGARRLPEKLFQEQMESALQTLHPAPDQKWVTAFHVPHLYLNMKLAQTLGLNPESFLNEASRTIQSLDSVAHVYVPNHIDATDPYADVYERSIYTGRSGDLLLRMKEGVLLGTLPIKTSHESPYPYDTHVPLILWGPDFVTGHFQNPVTTYDLAPTCAQVLGVPFSPGPGSRILNEATKHSILSPLP